MAVSRALRRLLHLRNLEEEQARLALEAKVEEVKRLKNLQVATEERERQGRRLVEGSMHRGELAERMAGLVEIGAAQRREALLVPMVEDGEIDIADLRSEFLLRRVDSRQAETLIAEMETREAVEGGRRAQRNLDDWFLSRLLQGETTSRSSDPPEDAPNPFKS